MHPVKVLHFIILPSITYPCKYLANLFLLLDLEQVISKYLHLHPLRKPFQTWE